MLLTPIGGEKLELLAWIILRTGLYPSFFTFLVYVWSAFCRGRIDSKGVELICF